MSMTTVDDELLGQMTAAVVEAEPFGPTRDRRVEEIRLWRALAKFHVPKDILVFSLDEAQDWRDSRSTMCSRALREDRVLYERH